MLTLSVFTVLLSGCAVGGHAAAHKAVSTCAVSFTTQDACRLKVYVDDAKGRSVRSLEAGRYADRRDFRRTSRNTLRLPSGIHRIRVERAGKELYCEELNMTSATFFIIKL